MKHDRKLRWRVHRGRKCLDLIEERAGEAPSIYIGLINGREAARAMTQAAAGAALIQAACQ